jgi:hypothetical protein
VEIDAAIAQALRGERLGGELLPAREKMNRGAKPGKTGIKTKPLLDDTPTLADVGLDKKTSSRMRLLEILLNFWTSTDATKNPNSYRCWRCALDSLATSPALRHDTHMRRFLHPQIHPLILGRALFEPSQTAHLGRALGPAGAWRHECRTHIPISRT